MAKKRGKAARASSRGKVTKVIHESTKEVRVDRALTDNFIALQKVMVNLSVKFDSLSTQISKLLELFEISAKNLARKDMDSTRADMMQASYDSKKVIERLDMISQQAGLIGKGLALIHEVNSENRGLQARPVQTSVTRQQKPVFSMPAKPLPKKPGLEEISSELSEYEKSEPPAGFQGEKP